MTFEDPPPTIAELIHENRSNAAYMEQARAYAVHAYAAGNVDLACAVARADGWTPEHIAVATEVDELEAIGRLQDEREDGIRHRKAGDPAS